MGCALRNVLTMPQPKSVVHFVMSSGVGRQEEQECTIEATDSLALVRAVMRRTREIRAGGGVVMWTDFVIDGIHRRRYVDGRSSMPRVDRDHTGDDTGGSATADTGGITS